MYAIRRELEHVSAGHTGVVSTVVFSPDGRRLASCSSDDTVRIWDGETGELRQMIYKQRVRELSFSSDGRTIITESGCINLDQSSPCTTPTPKWSGYGLDPDMCWITKFNGEKVLWLPPQYRPRTSAVRKDLIVIGGHSGRLLFIRFNSSIAPK